VRGRRHGDAVRITTAARPRSEDIRGRERRYIVSMGIRSVCFLVAVLTAGHWYMWAFLGAAFVLPTIAVVVANAGAAPDPMPAPEAFDPRLRALNGGPPDPPAR
jgi:hypothetical protein